jgi:hypothetical protein
MACWLQPGWVDCLGLPFLTSNHWQQLDSTADEICLNTGGPAIEMDTRILTAPDPMGALGLSATATNPAQRASERDLDAGFVALISTWVEFRPILLEYLSDMSACGRCGGRVDLDKGTSRFVNYNRIPTDPNFVDDTSANLMQRAPGTYAALNKLLFEKCFCFFTIPSVSSLPIEAARSIYGPMPPVEQFSVRR